VAAGETVTVGELTVGVADRLDVTLNWPGSELDLRLYDPQGRLVTPGYPGAAWKSRDRPRHLVVHQPLSGIWRLAVQGIEVTGAAEPFHVTASIQPTPLPTPFAPLALLIVLLAIGGLGPWIRREAGLDGSWLESRR
jgi:hypothetical protein